MTVAPPKLLARDFRAVGAVMADAEVMVDEREGCGSVGTKKRDAEVRRGLEWLERLLGWEQNHGAAYRRRQWQLETLLREARDRAVLELNANTDSDVRHHPELAAMNRWVARVDRLLKRSE